MQFGKKIPIGELQVGDVVRVINGYNTADFNRERSKWEGPELGGPNDFRNGYDVMTVRSVTEDRVTFMRPYWHIYADGSTNEGTEMWGVPLTNGSFYELLSTHIKPAPTK